MPLRSFWLIPFGTNSCGYTRKNRQFPVICIGVLSFICLCEFELGGLFDKVTDQLLLYKRNTH